MYVFILDKVSIASLIDKSIIFEDLDNLKQFFSFPRLVFLVIVLMAYILKSFFKHLLNLSIVGYPKPCFIIKTFDKQTKTIFRVDLLIKLSDPIVE